MAIKRIDMAWIVGTQHEASKKFMIETLGLQLTQEAAEWGWFECAPSHGGMHIGVAQANEHHTDDKAGQNAVIVFTVDDIVESRKELEAKGVKFIDEIMEVPGHVKLTTFVDPDGNRYQLAEKSS